MLGWGNIKKGWLFQAIVGILSVVIAFVATLLLSPWLHPSIILLFFVALALSIWLSGWGINDREQTAEALRHNQELFSALIENAPFGVYMVDAAFRLQQINKGAEAAFSNIDPLIGRDFAEILRILWTEPFATEAIDRFRHTLATGKSYYSPTIIEPRANIDEIQAYDWQLHRITLPDGSNGVVCYFYDLSEIKRAEEIVRKTAERDAFLVTLTDALRPLSDPVKVQATANEILGKQLGANRVTYFEVEGTDYVVERDYVNQVPTIAGRYPMQSFGSTLLEIYRQGTIACSEDIEADPNLSSVERAAFAAIQTRAYIGVPLIKGGEFVAGLAVQHFEPRVWTENEIAIVRETAERTWAAVERARAEKALRESETKYRNLFESIDEGFCLCEMLFDQNGEPDDYRFLAVNPIFESVTGLKDALGKTARQLVPDLEPFWFETYGRVVQTGEPVRFENHSVAMDRWFDVNAFRVGEAQSHQFAVLFTNISDRKQIEIALQDSEEQFRNMADNAPFMVWVTDPTGYCTYLSQSWYNFTGQTPEASLGLGWLEMTHPEDREQAERIFLEANARREAFQIEYRLRRHDGEYIWAIDAASPWWGIDGRFKGYIGSVIDITDRKRTEQEREQLLALEQTALAEAQSANRIKDEFLAVLSHELRSPLNPILGWTKLLQMGGLDATTTAQALSTIERNAKLQSSLIEDLLDVSKILQGKLSLTISPVNLATAVQAAIETVQLAAEAKSIQMDIILAADGVQVLGDLTRLQQMVWNLLSNAIKFTPTGGQVSVKLEQIGREARITVSDTGKGIPANFLPYVFDSFRQEDGAITRKFGGLGLGLAIVRYLVELHGGTIEVASAGEGLGATFTVRLPITSTGSALNREASSVQGSHDLNGLQVLVIDDEPDSREFLAFVLRQVGAIVTTAENASEGFAVLTQSRPDILLSDIGMPDMDGYRLMQQIRTLPPNQGGEVKAIALTAFAGEVNRQKAIAAGFQSHISKPVEPDTLIQTIAKLVHSGS